MLLLKETATSVKNQEPEGSPMYKEALSALGFIDYSTILQKESEGATFVELEIMGLRGLSNAWLSGDSNVIWLFYNFLGILYKDYGVDDSALLYLDKAQEHAGRVKDYGGQGGALNNMSLVFKRMGRLPEAIEYAHRGLVLAEKGQYPHFVGYILMNIGDLNDAMMQYETAYKAHCRAMGILKNLGDEYTYAGTLVNLASICSELGKPELKIGYLLCALKIFNKMGPSLFKSIAEANLALQYSMDGRHEKALEMGYLSLETAKAVQSEVQAIQSKYTIGRALFHLDKHSEARKWLTEALEDSKRLNHVQNIGVTAGELSALEEEKGNYKIALDYHRMQIIANDSLLRQENKLELMRHSYKYEADKRAAADSLAFALQDQIKASTIARQKSEIASKNQRQIAMAFGLGLLLVLTVFIYNRLRVISSQKKVIEARNTEVERQHRLLEEKNTTIMESITYAKRIQTAILPPPRVVKEYLKESFILYLPKDIVAGDFYWMEQSGDLVMFAAADCTGHGVPGAMVSVICTNGLNRSVREFGLTDPADILNKTRDIVMLEFEKSDEEVKDGMDISLCVLDGYQLAWAGANNPLWIVRNGEMLAWEPDKQPIGKFARHQPFTTHHITLQPGDMIYALTDGFQDQFGGEGEPGVKPGGRKFRPKALKELITSLAHHSPVEQRDALLTSFDQWRGNLEQVDDVCILGVRI